MNMNEEVNTDIRVQGETEKEPVKKSKPKVIVTLLKVAGYIISYILMNLIWLTVFVLITFLQYRPDFGDEWGFFLQNKDMLSKFIIAIIKRTYMLNWYVLAGGATWILLLFIFFHVRKQPVLERTGLKKCSLVFLIAGVLIGIGSKLFIDGIYSLWPQLNGGETAGNLAAASFKDIYLADPNTGISAMLSILAVGIITPIAEEIIFRGICFSHLKKIWPVSHAVAVISVIFGLMHFTSVTNMLYMALWGALLCLMAYRSGSIVPSIVSHMSLNLIAMYRLLNGVKFRTDTGVWMFVFGIVFLIGGVIVLLRLRPSMRNEYIGKRSYEEVYLSEFSDVFYVNEKNVVLVHWKKYCELEQYRTPLEKALIVINEHEGCNYVADTRDGFEDNPLDTRWVAEYFMPKAKEYGCRIIYFIIDEENSLKEELEGQEKDSEQLLEFRYINGLDEIE